MTVTAADGRTAAPITALDVTLGSVRLVRLRLVLALLAAALLPVALLAPVAGMLTDDARDAQQLRLATAASQVAADVSVDLEGARASAALIAASPEAVVVLDGGRAGSEIARAVSALRRRAPFVTAVDAVPLRGAPARIWSATPGAIDQLGPSLLASVARMQPGWTLVDATSSTRADRVHLLVPIGSRDAIQGAVRVEIALDELLEQAAADATTGEQLVAIRSSAEQSARAYTGAEAAPDLAGDVIGRAIDPVGGLTGQAVVGLSVAGFEGWSIELHEPFAVTTLAPSAVLGLALMALVVIGLLLLMARGVLRPAYQLEASRERLRTLYAEERELSIRDQLTGLGNHRGFQEELTRQLAHASRYRTPLSLLLMDLDEFKQVNDTMGHAVGDDLLAEVGRIVQATIRIPDRPFRTGGDEFAIILPNTGVDGALELGKRLLRRMLEDRPGSAYSRPISFSGGVANLPDQASSRVELLARADAAMYRSKRNGRTLVTVFDSAVDRPVLEGAARARLSDQLARVIAERQLHPVYQPIVDVATGGCVAYEGLIRPVRGSGFASPGELFGAAEVTGRVTELDRACLEAVLAGAAEIPDAVSLSLNISPRTFEAPEFSAAAFLKIIDRHGLEPGRVILELTERESIEDVDRLRGALEACRAAGIRIAADDVGAGNAGIRLLSQIQFDVMKIDLSLVQAGAGREPVASVLRSLVDLGSRWRAMVIAEGVETPDQLRMIRTLGIQAVQGYLLARPGPVRTDLRFDFAALDAQATDWAARRPTWEQIGGAVRATPAS